MLDLAMPDIKSGLEMFKKLRLDEEKTGHIHIILLADKTNECAQKIVETLKIEINEFKKVQNH